QEYVEENGDNPFREWLEELDKSVAARIQARVFRFETGNLGDAKNLKDGIWEAKFDIGPGYRLYFGRDGLVVVVLLCGGDKSSQASDIEKAKHYWDNYKSRKGVDHAKKK
ncbi:MAG: type II toxin-antitoxin system RelE/ParE family toxin, partial [Deltaproteobacteria bacterium]|nr:type II toxin-antitoxin system RelE/ParE family toxin [Deltaproteobacteria bacterium]